MKKNWFELTLVALTLTAIGWLAYLQHPESRSVEQIMRGVRSNGKSEIQDNMIFKSSIPYTVYGVNVEKPKVQNHAECEVLKEILRHPDWGADIGRHNWTYGEPSWYVTLRIGNVSFGGDGPTLMAAYGEAISKAIKLRNDLTR